MPDGDGRRRGQLVYLELALGAGNMCDACSVCGRPEVKGDVGSSITVGEKWLFDRPSLKTPPPEAGDRDREGDEIDAETPTSI
jgi:hypothetical protein